MSVVKGFITVLAAAFVLVLVSSISSAPLLAQGGQRDPAARQARAQAQFDSMTVFLGLNAKQKTDAKAAFDAQTAAQNKLREEMQAGGDPAASREARTKITTDYNTKLQAILNADQKAKLTKWTEAHPQRGGRRNN